MPTETRPVTPLADRPPMKRPLDLTVFGILFLLSAPMELWNIMRTDWTYTPKFFGFILTGLAAKVYLAAQPLLHLALGYGFLTMRRWALYLALVYAADVLTSTVSSFILHGYGRYRAIFLVFLTPFVAYVIARRRFFVR
jgi:hypothetical protein